MDGIGLCFLSLLICVTGCGYADIWAYKYKIKHIVGSQLENVLGFPAGCTWGHGAAAASHILGYWI